MAIYKPWKRMLLFKFEKCSTMMHMVCITVLFWGVGGWVMSKKKTFRLEKIVDKYGQPFTRIRIYHFVTCQFLPLSS